MNNKKQITKFGFIVLSLSAAIGLGVIWGLPEYINKYGGFYFFLIYIFAILIIGIPLLIFEFNLGNLRRKSLINIFDKENINFSYFIGWFQSILMIIIPIYYSILVGYTIISIGIIFYSNFINIFNKNIFNYYILLYGSFGVTKNGGFQWIVFLVFVSIVLLVGIVLLFEIKGIEKINKFFMPLMFLIVLILAIYIFKISGSHQGLKILFLLNNLEKLKYSQTWCDAFYLSFFTTSLGMGMMIRFSSVAPYNQDNTSKAYLLIIGILFFSIINLIFIFGASSVIVNNLITNKNNIFLFQQQIISKFGNNSMVFIFNILPEFFYIINQKYNFIIGNFLGFLFFLALFIAGLSTLISNIEVIIDSIKTQYKISNKKVIFGICLTIIIVGLLLVFENTYEIINSFQLLTSGLDLILISLSQVIFFVWYEKKINIIIKYNNKTSWIKLNKLYKIMMYFLIPLILIIIIIFSIYNFIISCVKNYWYFSLLSFIIGIFIPILLAILNSFYGIKYKRKCKKQ